MENKCGCGCQNNFVPVNGNWDFNCCEQYQQNHVRRNRHGNDGGCDGCGQNYNRAWKDDDCQCERCDDDRQVERCDKNTYVREMEDDCGCKDDDRGRNRSNGCQKCGEYESNYDRGRSNCSGKDDCQCDECTRMRNRKGRSNGCGKDWDDYGESACNRRRSGNCGCKDNASTYARSGKNRKVGMINVERQEIDEIFESESALRAGTIFPELHKPMNGYCPCDGNCGTCKQAAAFAAWELRLYLNTHPNDKEALALFRKLCKEAEEPNYATSFLKDDCCANGWDWVKNPWPWEFDCKCGD